jgi:DNA-binding MarR family transcriptional regulator
VTGLTPQLHRCLQTIAVLTMDGVSPSYDEIGGMMGLAKSGVSRMIGELEQRGYVRRLPGQSRSLHLTRPVKVTAPDKADILEMDADQLTFHLGIVTGALAHKIGPAKLRETLDRIGNRLGGSR